MAPPDKTFTIIPAADTDPDSPLTTQLVVSIVDNTEHLEQWLGDSFVAAKDHDHDNVNSKEIVGANFVLVERKEITTAVASVTFSGLNGETDEIYKLFGRIRHTVILATGAFELRPNGITTNQFTRGYGVDLTPTATTFSSSKLTLARNNVSASQPHFIAFEAILWARRTVTNTFFRMFMSNGVTADSGLPSPGLTFAADSFRGTWIETATIITSLVVADPLGTLTIGVGSTLALYKIRQT